jgi:multicomponent Na+:H+ antiporter subunit B
MSRRGRIALFAIAGPGLAAVLILGFAGLPDFGHYHGVYGRVVIGVELAERHATDLVTALNFDIRAFDTLGEEFILFTSVMGVVLLLRRSSNDDTGEDDDDKDGNRRAPPTSDAVRVLGLALVGLTVSFGLYIVTHGAVSPGGGFQGGVIIASSAMLIFLGEGYRGWRKLMRSAFLDACEGGGATLYALCGFASMAAGAPFLHNILPLGTPRDVFSGGLMVIENAGVGFAVAGGFGMLFLEFMEETRTERDVDAP